MSEHPPVPCPDPECRRPLVRDGARFLCEDGSSFSSPWGLIADELAELWHEWTRGMAVVPLPEPDEHGFHDFNDGAHCVYGYHSAGKGGPMVHVQFGRYGDLDAPAAMAQSVAAAMIASAAEQLAAEANAEAVAFCSQHCTPVIGEHVGDTVLAHDMACPHYDAEAVNQP